MFEVASIDAWHAKRIDGLKREDGWLSLVALDWLEEGTHPVEGFGTLTLGNGKATVDLSAGVQATVAGKPFASGMLKIEGEEGGLEKLQAGSKAIIVIKRAAKFAVRMWDANAETRTSFHGIDRYPVSEKWKITARWVAYKTPKKTMVETVIPGFQEEYLIPGVAIFRIGGKEYRLEPALENPGADFFFIFGDKTNGKETYGAGRFLYTSPAQDGKVIIDFNKAYNPPCAFTPFATCPLPLAANKPKVRIEAGEKEFGEH